MNICSQQIVNLLFCQCGLPLYNGICKRCKDKKKTPKVLRGRYSGGTKRMKGAYECY